MSTTSVPTPDLVDVRSLVGAPDAEADLASELGVRLLPGPELGSAPLIDTTDLRVVPDAGAEPLDEPAAEATAVVPPCRAELRAERRQARRVRRVWAVLGISVLLATVGGTVAVLDVLH